MTIDNSIRTVGIIQARMGSTRLPGKVLKNIGNFPVLAHVINRTMLADRLDEVVVTTSTEKQDDLIFELCLSMGINCFRGKESNVLERYLDAASRTNADIVVRITADCPLISYQIINSIIDFRKEMKADYASNTIRRTYPHGLDVEAFTYKSLEKAARSTKFKYDFEHVTSYIYQHPDKFMLASYEYEKNFSDIRLTLDTFADYSLFLELIKCESQLMNPEIDWKDIVTLIMNKKNISKLHTIAKLTSNN